MPSGSCERFSELPEDIAALFAEARRAVLATLAADGRPQLLPICFALRGDELVSAIDNKPKDRRSLARLRNIERDPRVGVLVDRWDEDWSRLSWARVEGEAHIESPGAPDDELRRRYPQYEQDPPDGEVIVVRPHRIVWWAWQ